MKQILILFSLILLVVACAPAEVAVAPAETETEALPSGKVSGDTLLELVAQGKVTVIDVRTPEEYAQGHVEGAVNFPVEDIMTDPAIVTLAKDQPIALYCRTGVRSGEAFKVLQEYGFTRIYDAPGVAIYNYELVK